MLFYGISTTHREKEIVKFAVRYFALMRMLHSLADSNVALDTNRTKNNEK